MYVYICIARKSDNWVIEAACSRIPCHVFCQFKFIVNTLITTQKPAYKAYIRLCNLFYGTIHDHGAKCRTNKASNNLLGLIELKFMSGSPMPKFEKKMYQRKMHKI